MNAAIFPTEATETKSSDSVGELCTPQNYEREMQLPTNLVQLHGSVPIRLISDIAVFVLKRDVKLPTN